MSRSVTVPVVLYSDQTGLTLQCQPYTAAGATTGAVVAGTTVERGSGAYRWTGTVPDDATVGDFRNAADSTFLTQEVLPAAATATPPTASVIAAAVVAEDVIQNIAASVGTEGGTNVNEGGGDVTQTLPRPDGATMTRSYDAGTGELTVTVEEA